jgi:hypothetical protein
MVAELSHRLARIWKPEVETARKTDMQEAWHTAATQDVETDTDLFIVPQLGNYTINQ